MSFLSKKVSLAVSAIVFSLLCVSAFGYSSFNDDASVGFHIESAQGTHRIDPDSFSRLDWSPVTESVNRGYDSAPYWYKLSVTNNTDSEIDKYIEINYPFLENVRFYESSPVDNKPEYHTGRSQPISSRPVESRTFAFPVSVSANSSETYYLNVETSGSHRLPFKLWDPMDFHESKDTLLFTKSALLGALVIMGISNIIFFWMVSDKAYVYLSLFQIGSSFVLATVNGIAAQFIFPDTPGFHTYAVTLGVPLITIALVLLAREYIGSGSIFSEKLTGTAIVFSGTLLVFANFFLPFSQAAQFSLVTLVVVIVTICSASMVRSVRTGFQGRYFFLGWLLFTACLSLYIMNIMGVKQVTSFNRDLLEIGVVLASLIWSFGLGRKVYQEKNEYQKLKSKAERDAQRNHVTGAPNRRCFEDFISSRVGISSSPFAVVVLHFESFGRINKTLGHETADEVIHTYVENINEYLKSLSLVMPIQVFDDKQYMLAHIEGVTFAAVMKNRNPHLMEREITMLSRKARESVHVDGLDIDISLVIGISRYPENATDPSDLVQYAFVAFDDAWSAPDKYAFYRPENNQYSTTKLTLMNELRNAILNDEVSLNFQPKISMPDRTIYGFEALIRWNHPVHGFIPPDDFIPMAESTGVIHQLTEWVLNKGLAFRKKLEQKGFDIQMAINISMADLRDPGFIHVVRSLIAKHKTPPDKLTLEVTETAAMADPEHSMQALRQLHEIGVRISIDDFGTGYSSLSYIKRFPVDEIKIDRSFVMTMDSDQDDQVIVRATLNMCHDLGYEVVAEGIETEEITQKLQEMKCDLGQGYYISKPIAMEKVSSWVEEYQGSLKDKAVE